MSTTNACFPENNSHDGEKRQGRRGFSLLPPARADRGRFLSRHEDQEYIELAKKEMKTRGCKQSQRKRKQIEELFGEAKELMGFRRMKFRGRATVKEQVFLTAAAQNIKRLVKHLAKGTLKPAGALRVKLETTEKQRKTGVRGTCRRFLATFYSLFLNFSGIFRRDPRCFAIQRYFQQPVKVRPQRSP